MNLRALIQPSVYAALGKNVLVKKRWQAMEKNLDRMIIALRDLNERAPSNKTVWSLIIGTDTSKKS